MEREEPKMAAGFAFLRGKVYEVLEKPRKRIEVVPPCSFTRPILARSARPTRWQPSPPPGQGSSTPPRIEISPQTMSGLGTCTQHASLRKTVRTHSIAVPTAPAAARRAQIALQMEQRKQEKTHESEKQERLKTGENEGRKVAWRMILMVKVIVRERDQQRKNTAHPKPNPNPIIIVFLFGGKQSRTPTNTRHRICLPRSPKTHSPSPPRRQSTTTRAIATGLGL